MDPGLRLDQPPHQLLVALGDDTTHGALDWAVERARRSGQSLRLVHVVHRRHGLAGPENLLMTFDAGELAGRQIVAAALERVEDVAGDELSVSTVVPAGNAVETLSRLSAGCDAVVVQHHPHGRSGPVFGAAVTAGVAAHTDVPVISVPDTYQAARHVPPAMTAGLAPRVTVGVARIEEADELIAHAVGSAPYGPGSCLTILHAWHVAAVYELGLMPPDFETGWVEREAHALADLGEAWQEKLPDIRVETRLVHARPAPALVDASHNSEHLVLWRSEARPPRHVGSVSAALLRHSGCPVELVPPSRLAG